MVEGKIITLSGIDGSGKTTLADRAYRYLSASGVNATRLQVYSKSTFLNIGRLIGKISKTSKSVIESKIALRNKRKNVAINMLRLLCFLIDIIGFRIYAFFLKQRGVTLVCDRYLYDTLINLNYLSVVNNVQYECFLKIIPRPEVPIVLFLDEKTAQERENEHDDIGYYVEKARLYSELVEKLGIEKIDTFPPEEEVWHRLENILSRTRNKT